MRLQYRFVRGMGWDSKVIEWDTRAWCSHVEFLDEFGDQTFGAQLQGGVIWRSVSDPCYRNVSRSEVWEVPVQNSHQVERLSSFITESNGLPYDWRAILSFGLGSRDWTEPDSWFCSEWATMSLVRAGILAKPLLPACRITPRDFYLIVSMLPGARKL